MRKINKAMQIVLLSTTTSTMYGDPNLSHSFEDWVVSSEPQYLCCGYYREPKYPYPLGSDLSQQPMSITYDEGELTDSGTSELIGDVVTKKGNQTVYGDRVWLHHDEDSGELTWIKAVGDVVITEPGFRIDGTKAFVDVLKDQREIHHGHYRIYSRHGRGYGNHIVTHVKQRMTLDSATYTTCSPTQSVWYIKGKDVEFNKETGRGESWHSRLYFKDVPVFYWPYVNFPIDDRRQTGFLFPSVGNSSVYGATFIAPYYLNLAPNYDATLTPMYTAKRTFKLTSEFRYLDRYNQSLVLFDFLPNDKAYKHFRRESLAAPGAIRTNDLRYTRLQARESSKRYFFSWQHKLKINRHWRMKVDYSKASDDNYLQDFASASALNLNNSGAIPGTESFLLGGKDLNPNLTTLVPQIFDANYFGKYAHFGLTLSQFQILHPFKGPGASQPRRKLPEVRFSTPYHSIFQGVQTKALGSYVNWKVESIPTLMRLTTGHRYHIRPAITRPFIEPGWFVKPQVQLDFVHYDLDLSRQDILSNKPRSDNRAIPIYSVDAGLIFERPVKALKKQYMQTFEPRVFYLNVPRRDQTRLPVFDTGTVPFNYDVLWRDNRYSGYDRIGDTHQVSLGVSTAFINNSGTERARFSLGRIIYFRDRLVQLAEVIDGQQRRPIQFGANGNLVNPTYINQNHYSPYAGNFVYYIDRSWTASGDLVWDTANGRVDTFGVNLQSASEMKVVNFGYQFTRLNFNDVDSLGKPNPLSQFNVSGAVRVKPQLAMLARLNYDIQHERVVNLLAGLEYQSCCTAIRLAWTKTLRPNDNSVKVSVRDRINQHDHAWMLQFVFKGLGDVGSASKEFFSSQVPGYKAYDDKY